MVDNPSVLDNVSGEWIPDPNSVVGKLQNLIKSNTMKASEARELAQNPEAHKEKLKMIYDTILKEAKQGRLQCSFDKHFGSQVEELLKLDGYQVTSDFDRNEAFTIIKW